jgi:nuclear transport factor 2 (NTF2) superfamily protein
MVEAWHELWEFDENGLMKRRDASINDYKIDESERKFRWTRRDLVKKKLLPV